MKRLNYNAITINHVCKCIACFKLLSLNLYFIIHVFYDTFVICDTLIVNKVICIYYEILIFKQGIEDIEAEYYIMLKI